MLQTSSINFSFTTFNSSFNEALSSLISSANEYIILSTSSLSNFTLNLDATLYEALINKCENGVKCLLILREHINSKNSTLEYLKNNNISILIDETNTLNSIITENSIYTGSMAFSYNTSKTLVNSYFICNNSFTPGLYENIKENYLSNLKSIAKEQFKLLNTPFSFQIQESKKNLSSYLSFSNAKSTDSCCYIKKFLKENLYLIEQEISNLSYICFYKCEFNYYNNISQSLSSIKKSLSCIVKECECFDCKKEEYLIFENSELLNGLIRLNRNFSSLLSFLDLSKNKFDNNTFNFSAQSFHDILSL